MTCAHMVALAIGASIGSQAIVTFRADAAAVEYRLWILFAACMGAYVAMRSASDLFGQSGLKGALRAICGGAWFTAVFGVVAGSIALPFFGTMFGPFAAVMLIAGSPWVLAIWLTGLGLIHLMVKCWRTEQDRLFARLA